MSKYKTIEEAINDLKQAFIVFISLLLNVIGETLLVIESFLNKHGNE